MGIRVNRLELLLLLLSRVIHTLLRLHGLGGGPRLRRLLWFMEFGEIEKRYVHLSGWHRALALGQVSCIAMRVHSIIRVRAVIDSTLDGGRIVVLLTNLLKAAVHPTTVVVAGTRSRLLMAMAHVTQVVALRLISAFATID